MKIRQIAMVIAAGSVAWVQPASAQKVSKNPVGAGTRADTVAVHAAVTDYVEGFYQGDSTRHVRSVAPEVYKYGYARRAEGYAGMQMQYARFMSYDRGVKEGRNVPPANAPKDIILFDVQDQTASAKLVAWWGIDYLLLAKRDGRWMITHVLWQSPPVVPSRK